MAPKNKKEVVQGEDIALNKRATMGAALAANDAAKVVVNEDS